MKQSSTVQPTIKFDSNEQRVFLHLWRTYDLFKAVEAHSMARFDLTPQQYNVLRILKVASPHGVPTMQLGQQMISRGPDMTRMLDRLEAKKWIQRVRSEENRRAVAAVITAAGLDLLEAMSGEIIAMHQRQVGHLSPTQQTQLIRLLRLARQPHEDATCQWFE